MSATRTSPRSPKKSKTAKSSGFFSAVLRPVSNLIKGASNMFGVGVAKTVGTATHLVSHAKRATADLVHDVSYGTARVVDTGAHALNRTVRSVIGKGRKGKTSRKNRKNRKNSRKSKKNSRKNH